MNFKNKLPFFFFLSNKNFGILFICSLILLLLQMYLNTGTLSAYAVSLLNPTEAEGYIVNYDYKHYECNYNFIIGESADKWSWGWVLRRELFYILSYPLFKLFGFYIGGLLSAMIINLISFYFFIKFIYKNMGLQSAYITTVILASYPGIMYWIGSPFAQVMIVPCCCWVYVLVWKMSKTDELKKHVCYLAIISLLFTAYDLFIFFYPAILLIYFKHKQWKKIAVSLPIMITPQVLIVLWFSSFGVTELGSENSGLYLKIIQSYIYVQDFASWFEMMFLAPKYLLSNFLDSNFLFLPLLFIIFLILGWHKKIGLDEIELSILFCAFLVFLFTNMAPYVMGDTQLRGEWIARIYQPIFIVMLMYIVRFSSQVLQEKLVQRKYIIGLITACVAFNLAINMGGIFGSSLTQRAWYRFYMHAPQNTMTENLEKYGVRPVGF